MSVAQGSAVKGRTRWKRFASRRARHLHRRRHRLRPGDRRDRRVVQRLRPAVQGLRRRARRHRLRPVRRPRHGEGRPNPPRQPGPADPKNHSVAVSGIKEAKLYNLCQSVEGARAARQHGDPGRSGAAPRPQATDLLIDLTSLKGDATFENIQIGIDASDLTKGGANAKGLQGSFAQQADSVVITNLKQVAWSTTAGTFKLTGLDLSLSTGGTPFECF